MDEITVYKIRDKDTGLYSTGGYQPKWNSRGKTWNNLGAAKNHINNWCGGSYGKIKLAPDSWEIVEIVIKEEEANTWPVNDYINEVKRRRQIKETYGWEIHRALKQLTDTDTSKYRYLFVFDWVTLGPVLKDLKNLGIKRIDYRYRTPVLVFDDIDKAFVVKLAHGEHVKQFVDLVELKDIELS